MTALDSVRRRWTWGALGGGVIAAALLVVIALVGSDAVHEATRPVPATTVAPGRALPPTPAGLLGIRADDGSLAGVVVFAQAPPGEDGQSRGGTILPLPAATGVPTGADARLRPLSEHYARGGLDALAQAAGRALGVDFTVVAEADRTALGRFLKPVGVVPVTLAADAVTADPNSPGTPPTTIPPETTTTAPADTTVPEDSTPRDDTTVPTEDTTLGADSSLPTETTVAETTVPDDGVPLPVLAPGERLVFPAGEQAVGAVDGGALLAAERPGEPEVIRFENAVAYWTAIAAKVGAGISPAGGADDSAMGRFFGSMLAGPLRVYALRGTPITDTPSPFELVRLNQAEVIRVMATVLPEAVSRVGVSVAVQIINPTGDPALTQAAVERLAGTGVGIVLVRELTGIAVPPVTEWSSTSSADRQAEVQALADRLGGTVAVAVGAPGTPHGRVAGIDVTFVLGESLRDTLHQDTSAATTVPSGTVAVVTDPKTTAAGPTTGGGA